MPSSCFFVIYLGVFTNPYAHTQSLIHIFASTLFNTYNLPIFKGKHKQMICQIFPHISLRLSNFGKVLLKTHICGDLPACSNIQSDIDIGNAFGFFLVCLFVWVFVLFWFWVSFFFFFLFRFGVFLVILCLILDFC